MRTKLLAAVELGRKGGLARQAKMTRSQRSAHGRKMVAARWAKTTPEERRAFAKRIRAGKGNKAKGRRKK